MKELDAYAWPGGYPIIYLARSGHEEFTVCPDCANKDRNKPRDEREFSKFVGFVHWEGPPIDCDVCNEMVESAYGDPNDPEED